MSRLAPLLLAAVLGAACDRRPEQQPDREFAAGVLRGVLAYPRSSVVSVTRGADVAQATLSAPAPVDSVAMWYRRMLRLNGWDLQNDAIMNDGSIAISAHKGERPLWITLKATVGGAGTTYTLIGTELPKDSAAAQRSGSSMSSNRIQRR
jgi:hypothetical protein